MSYNFQKWYYTILFTLFLACAPDDIEFIVTQVSNELNIEEATGIQFDDNSVYDGAKFNIKTDEEGTYTVEILDLANQLVSRNTLKVKEGDNVYTVYTRVFQTGDYTFRFLDEMGNEKESVKLFVK